MTEDRLTKLLVQYGQAIEEEARIALEYSNAKNKDQALTQAKKDAEELYSKYCDANEKWEELNNEFNSKHKKLLESLDDAWRCRREVEKIVEAIINEIKGEKDEW